MRKSQLRKLIAEEVSTLLTEAQARVETREYETAHGKKPSGSGAWAFRLSDTRAGGDGQIIWPSSGSGSMKYNDALKIAQKKAVDSGKRYVIVMP